MPRLLDLDCDPADTPAFVGFWPIPLAWQAQRLQSFAERLFRNNCQLRAQLEVAVAQPQTPAPAESPTTPSNQTSLSSEVEHTPDFATMRVAEVEYTFTMSQRRVMKVIYTVYTESRLAVSEERLLRAANNVRKQGDKNRWKRLRDVFKRAENQMHLAWKTLIVPIEGRTKFYRFQVK